MPGKPDNQPGTPWARGVEADARSLGIKLDIVQADGDNLDGTLAALAANGARGLVVTADGIYQAHRKAVADGAIRHWLPSIFSFRQQAEAGGLLVYAARYADWSRRAAFFVDRRAKCCTTTDARKIPRDLHEDARDVARRKMKTKAFANRETRESASR